MKMRLRIKELLKEKGLTQYKLAQLSGVRESSLSALARNKQDAVNLRHLEKIAAALEVNPLELFEVEEN
ncbi:helix-turn-helix transcriptional regulator [Anoxynatronum sibiricum]|uniref:Helix-turn-helix transcriptional regulator n=1 Tax=Anoxynatronum sibiricum TaxID=210623 RepID=A0ABU9VX88_9CLOT